MFSRAFVVKNLGSNVSSSITRYKLLAKKHDSQCLFGTRSINNVSKIHHRIINNNNNKPFISLVSQATIQESNIATDDIELHVNGKPLLFNLTWLRDCCDCQKCTHQYSKQRLFEPKDFKRDMFEIKALSLSKDDESLLDINWTDGHKSSYSLNWLQKVHDSHKASVLKLGNQFTGNIQREFIKDQRTWNVSELESNLESVDYNDLVNGFKFSDDANFINANKVSEMNPKRLTAIGILIRQLAIYGIAKIVNVPLERNQVLNVARSLAYERPTGYGVVFDVIVEPSEEINLAYSSLEFDLHTDLPYRETSPGVQLLHCIRDSADGGLSYFSDTFRAARTILETEPVLFEVLLQFPVTFQARDPYRDMDFHNYRPIMTIDYNNYLKDVYYSPFRKAPTGFLDDIKLFYLAQDKLTKLLQSRKNKVVTKMNPGDLYIFHNRRVLHGRSSYDASTSSRFFQGCYMDWDEIIGLHHKLSRHVS